MLLSCDRPCGLRSGFLRGFPRPYFRLLLCWVYVHQAWSGVFSRLCCLRFASVPCWSPSILSVVVVTLLPRSTARLDSSSVKCPIEGKRPEVTTVITSSALRTARTSDQLFSARSVAEIGVPLLDRDRKSTRLNSSH